jgi:hypothetical protein
MRKAYVKIKIALGAATLFFFIATVVVCLLYTIGHFLFWQPIVVPSQELQLIGLRAIALITTILTTMYVLSADFKFKVLESMQRHK